MGLFPRQRQPGVYHARQPRLGGVHARNAARRGYCQGRHPARTRGIHEDGPASQAHARRGAGEQPELLRPRRYGLYRTGDGPARRGGHRCPARRNVLQSRQRGVGTQGPLSCRERYRQTSGDRLLPARSFGQGAGVDGNRRKSVGGGRTRSDTL